jgi:transcriptional regulator with XRE-family HTH domain
MTKNKKIFAELSGAEVRLLYRTKAEEAHVRVRLGQEVYDAREKVGINQKALAEKCGTTQRIVSNIENAEINPGIGLVYRIGKRLEFTAENWSRIFGFSLVEHFLGKIDTASFVASPDIETDLAPRYLFGSNKDTGSEKTMNVSNLSSVLP